MLIKEKLIGEIGHLLGIPDISAKFFRLSSSARKKGYRLKEINHEEHKAKKPASDHGRRSTSLWQVLRSAERATIPSLSENIPACRAVSAAVSRAGKAAAVRREDSAAALSASSRPPARKPRRRFRPSLSASS